MPGPERLRTRMWLSQPSAGLTEDVPCRAAPSVGGACLAQRLSLHEALEFVRLGGEGVDTGGGQRHWAGDLAGGLLRGEHGLRAARRPYPVGEELGLVLCAPVGHVTGGGETGQS